MMIVSTIFPKAFRGAVRKYGEIMWFPLSLLDVDNEQIFAKYSVEWEPFDVDEYINTYCMGKEIQRLNQEKLDAVKGIAIKLDISFSFLKYYASVYLNSKGYNDWKLTEK
ncbi:MAG: hypothetical protein H0A75_08120 [Candidatus Methanofishera endochildressiae]|uniref:Uncharacterized protein n=1 Tax=Candidatus Methanofishera endochildressiae TaxID=2738884 RepID=A0A7Z0SE16_9GAMM|nr:hypothetical protein [Candidatus Methanofishera endochildressiae]